ncbi:MAG: efflux RND transporter periplasmic adaptor subunit [Spirosomataceae bacterium]
MKAILYNSIWLLMAYSILIRCSSSDANAPKHKTAKSVTLKPKYQLGKVSLQNVGQTVQLPGEFKAFLEVTIYPKAEGFVEQVLVDRGSVVRKGQVLMVLDSPESEERLAAARSAALKAGALLTASREHYRRLKASSKVPGSVSDLDLETAHARMMADSASLLGEEANFRALTKIRSYLRVQAPFDGVITERNVHPGALVGSGTKSERPMMVLQQQNRLRLVLDIPETYSLSLKGRSTVSYTVGAIPEKVFQGKISRRSGNMNDQFRSETVEIDVPNPARQFKPGMFAEVLLKAEGTPGAVTVPASAVVASTERRYVIRVNEGRAQFVDVRPGQKSGDKTEVFGALKADDTIVVNAREDLKEGTEIQ